MKVQLGTSRYKHKELGDLWLQFLVEAFIFYGGKSVSFKEKDEQTLCC